MHAAYHLRIQAFFQRVGLVSRGDILVRQIHCDREVQGRLKPYQVEGRALVWGFKGGGGIIFVLDSNLTDYIIVLGMFVILHNRELLVEKMGF